jgi:hypothetical protein
MPCFSISSEIQIRSYNNWARLEQLFALIARSRSSSWQLLRQLSSFCPFWVSVLGGDDEVDSCDPLVHVEFCDADPRLPFVSADIQYEVAQIVTAYQGALVEFCATTQPYPTLRNLTLPYPSIASCRLWSWGTGCCVGTPGPAAVAVSPCHDSSAEGPRMH